MAGASFQKGGRRPAMQRNDLSDEPGCNPYQPPSIRVLPGKRQQGDRPWFSVCSRPWIAIGLSGVLFGGIGGPLGMFVGGLVAFPIAFFATLILFGLEAAVAGAAARGARLYILSAAAGFVSGATSLLLLMSGDFEWAIFFPAVTGAVGGMAGAWWESAHTAHRCRQRRQRGRNLFSDGAD